MEQVISKKTLENLLSAIGAAVIDLGDEEKKAFACLWEICNNAQKDNLLLVNLSDCEEYVLWKGTDDVRFIAESGFCQDELQSMSEDEMEAVFSEVSNRVDWSDVASASIAAGNSLIEEEFECVLKEMNKGKE